MAVYLQFLQEISHKIKYMDSFWWDIIIILYFFKL